MCLHNVDILEKFLKDQALNKKYISEKDDLEILRCFIKSVCHLNLSICRIFRFINKCARKKKS